MKKTTLFIAIAFIGILCISSSTAPSIKPKWQQYSHSATNVSIKFPSSFEETTSENDEQVKTTKVSSSFDDAVYFVGITIHTPDFEYENGLEDVSLESFASSSSGTIVSREPWNHQKHIGVQARIETTDFIMLYKVVIFDRKQIQVVVAFAKDAIENTKTNAKFFKSLKLM